MAGLPSLDDLAALVATTADDDTASGRLRRAIQVSGQLAECGDGLVERFVSQARGAGASWTEIGETFGTSKQAAQKRYGVGPVAPGSWPGRWTPRARRVLDTAAEQARALRHTYIGTEHVLLGLLLVQDEMAPHVLGELGVTSEIILAQGLPGPCDPRTDEYVSLMPRLKRALNLALRLGERHEHGYADSDHLLVAITQTPHALAIELLEAVGVSASDVRIAVAHRLHVDPESLLPVRRRPTRSRRPARGRRRTAAP